jgi:3-oxoacyl-[acyl-carrier protein] reductase
MAGSYDMPLGRPGTADEAARVMLFLASPLASYVTGACTECTGGRYL